MDSWLAVIGDFSFIYNILFPSKKYKMLIDSNYWLYENMGVLFFIISCVFTFIKLIKEGNFL